MHFALLGHKGALNDDAVMQKAKEVGLDLKKLQDDMKSPEIMIVLGKNRDLAEALGVDGTPAMVIGETMVDGAVGQGRLAELIAAARKK